MNYYASPAKGAGYVKPLKYWVDVENGAGTIPGVGDDSLTLTRWEDVAKQVVAVLDLAQWPKEPIKGQGDEVSFNWLIATAEQSELGRRTGQTLQRSP